MRPSQAAITPPSGTSPRETNSSRPRRMRQDSLENLDSDPWASPAMSKPLGPPTPGSATKLNGIIQNGASADDRNLPARTTSTFTTHGASGNGDGAGDGGADPSSGAGDWAGYNNDSTAGFSDQSTLGGGFGRSGEDQETRGSRNPDRSGGVSTTLGQGTGESITVTMLPEKEGMFMFQHRNYEVKSLRRGTSVIRRYSDFVWLLDCLLKRYPFRRLPLLPPKRVSGMSNEKSGQHQR